MQVDLFDEEFNRILHASTYEDFATRLHAYDCRRCSLCASRSNIVIDRGNPQAAILIISERPGSQEDIEGKAFVGRSGELLDKILASIGIDANRDTLICNIVKCKPDEDRAPTSDEAAACLPFLERQIALVKPRVVLLLGHVALKWICPTRKDFKMEEEAGRFFTLARFPKTQFMVLFHPAFLLRDPRKKRPMWAHIRHLRAYLDEQGIAAIATPPAPQPGYQANPCNSAR